jgi:hypothetical protein
MPLNRRQEPISIRMEMGNGVRQSWLRGAEACIRANGGHFEHLL